MDGLELGGQWKENPEICLTRHNPYAWEISYLLFRKTQRFRYRITRYLKKASPSVFYAERKRFRPANERKTKPICMKNTNKLI